MHIVAPAINFLRNVAQILLLTDHRIDSPDTVADLAVNSPYIFLEWPYRYCSSCTDNGDKPERLIYRTDDAIVKHILPTSCIQDGNQAASY